MKIKLIFSILTAICLMLTGCEPGDDGPATTFSDFAQYDERP